MTEPTFIRMRRAVVSLHRTDMLIPVLGLSAISLSGYAMAAVAQAFPETALLPDGFGQCNPLMGDFGCGHGFGCACHMLPEPVQTV
ncbi:MAG: hypothetical protein ACXIU7_11535 [Roseinatronobacter sp.]